MSLWPQAATAALEAGDYAELQRKLLPRAPIPVPGCLLRELEFAGRRCRDHAKDRLFPATDGTGPCPAFRAYRLQRGAPVART